MSHPRVCISADGDAPLRFCHTPVNDPFFCVNGRQVCIAQAKVSLTTRPRFLLQHRLGDDTTDVVLVGNETLRA